MKVKLNIVVFVTLIWVLMLSACAPAPAPPPREPEPVEQQRDQTERLSNEARDSASQFGYSVEAWNLTERIKRTNDPAHVEYVYLLSPYTGQIILQATAIGKVTSTTKRLDPGESYELTEKHDCGEWACDEYLYYERVGPDGTYGSSTPGVVWYDTSGQKMEAKIGGALMIILERPYVFEEGKALDLTVDIRLQGQLDETRDGQRERIVQFIKENPDWRPGDEIPIGVMSGEN